MPVLLWKLTPNPTPDPLELTEVIKLRRSAAPESSDLATVAFELVKRPGSKNPLTAGVTLGRVEDNDLVLDDASISRFHAYFTVDRDGQWSLTDAESKNGTFLGPLRLSPKKPEPLRSGTRVRVGNVELEYLDAKGLAETLKQLAT